MPFADYFADAVVRPLGLSGRLAGSPAHAYRGPLGDLLAVGRELLQPTLVAPETLGEATTVQFPGLDGVLPGLGRMEPNDWGLTFELRDAKSPHWTGSRNSERTFGHFGASGTFLWVDPDAGVACGVLTDRRFGDWAKEAWPAVQRRGARRDRLVVVGEERSQELVERRPVAARHHRGCHRGHGRRSRHVHRRRDLAEVVAGPEHATCAEVALADGQDSGEEDVEAVVGVALADEDRARRDLLALHALPEPGERLARQPGEQLDPGELVLCGGAARRG